MDTALLRAYRYTIYQVDDPLWRLRIGQQHPDFDRWLATQEVQTWGFITAYNPFSQVLAAYENAHRLDALHQELQQVGYRCYLGRGLSADPDSTWEPEVSLLVLGIAQAEAIATGRRWQQNAVVWGQIGGLVQLCLCQAESS
jgi:hypothetical protein